MNITGEVKFIGDPLPGGYANGLTMIDSGSMKHFNEISKTEDETVYRTTCGIALRISHRKGKNDNVRVLQTTIENGSSNTKVMELLTSFKIEGLHADKLHRMLSFWSAEGRHHVDDLTDLNMELAWANQGVRVIKFGSLGSMPVRSFFPFMALEDSTTGKFIGVSLYSPSSWQMEVKRERVEELTISGGIADRDYGHWKKELKPGDIFEAPKAVIAEGTSFLEVCDLLVKEQTPDISPVDAEMGITFNEYCTTWGNPSFENIKKITDKIAGHGIQYLVMDCGWYIAEGEKWYQHIGDWKVDPGRFPNGLKECTDYVRDHGMIPGIWYEVESLSDRAPLYNEMDYILKRDGYPLSSGGKHYLDMEADIVKKFLKEKVIDVLKENNYGYIKIDYNDSIGVGCDGAESLGEGLRRKVKASQEFFKELKRVNPDLVIENCSSGGHRLEPSMMELSSMASFSDAHETLSVPIIAANEQLLVRPEQNQIWAVMRKEDSDARIYYSIINTCLGRMGLSGDIYDLSDHQWALIDEGIKFYKEASDIIKDGSTIILDSIEGEWLKPKGQQFTVRKLGHRSLAILHRFADTNEAFTLPDYLNGKKVLSTYGHVDVPFSAKAWILKEDE